MLKQILSLQPPSPFKEMRHNIGMIGTAAFIVAHVVTWGPVPDKMLSTRLSNLTIFCADKEFYSWLETQQQYSRQSSKVRHNFSALEYFISLNIQTENIIIAINISNNREPKGNWVYQM